MPRKPFLLLAALLAAASLAAAQTPPKVSEFNRYSGDSQPVYDGWVRSSRYVATRDGTRLAVDIFRPARGGKVTEEKLPVVWTHHRYQRSHVEEGKVYTILDSYEWMPEVVRHGYVVAAVDVRGSGASFGKFTGMFNLPETQDAYDITEWLASQPWSNGNVGMYGGSYLGITQYMAASQKPPHLKAIFPEVAVMDLYALLWHGGIFHGPSSSSGASWCGNWMSTVPPCRWTRTRTARCSRPRSRSTGRTATRRSSTPASPIATAPIPRPVSRSGGTGPRSPTAPRSASRRSPSTTWPAGTTAMCGTRRFSSAIWTTRRSSRSARGPTPESDLGSAAEHLRWWDRWLKGIDNGVMDDAPVHYYVMGAPEATAWRSAKAWPLPNERRTAYWLGPRQSLGTRRPRRHPRIRDGT